MAMLAEFATASEKDAKELLDRQADAYKPVKLNYQQKMALQPFLKDGKIREEKMCAALQAAFEARYKWEAGNTWRTLVDSVVASGLTDFDKDYILSNYVVWMNPNRLKSARTHMGMSQEEVAKLTGYSHGGYISNLENAQYDVMGVRKIVIFSKAVSIDPVALCEGRSGKSALNFIRHYLGRDLLVYPAEGKEEETPTVVQEAYVPEEGDPVETTTSELLTQMQMALDGLYRVVVGLQKNLESIRQSQADDGLRIQRQQEVISKQREFIRELEDALIGGSPPARR